jgi:hypothetical protein
MSVNFSVKTVVLVRGEFIEVFGFPLLPNMSHALKKSLLFFPSVRSAGYRPEACSDCGPIFTVYNKISLSLLMEKFIDTANSLSDGILHKQPIHSNRYVLYICVSCMDVAQP